MREIKFRAANTDNKGRFISWVYGTPEFGDMGQLYMHYAIGAIMLCQRASLGQYTGLKDKNGKEIYEGDITRGTFRTEFGSIEAETIAAVEWKNEKACFVAVINGDWFFLGKHLEVIGNIYENPDLLSAPKQNHE